KYMKDEPSIQEFCYFNNWYYYELVHYGEKKQQINILDTQKNFFDFCPFEFVKGDINTAFPDENSIVLEEKTAQSLFGKEDPIGKEVLYSKRKMIVRGVYKIPGKSSFEPDAVTNLLEKARLKGNEDSWGNFNFGLILKTKSPEDADKARKAVENIYFEYRTKPYAKEEGLSLEEYIEKNGTIKIQLTSLANSRLYSPVEDTPEGNANYQLMLIMLGLSILILVLSVVNYVNLATANAIKRAKEVGVRKILGATKKNIIRQFIFETVLITIMAIVLA